MKIITTNNNKFIDQDLFNYINNVWSTFDIEIDNDSCIYFSKNTTVNRLITDYCGKKISRVIKKEKADYLIINKFELRNFPQYFDDINNCITEDDTKEVVYAIYNQSCEVQDTIELILDFIDRKQEIKFVNQNKLNDSLNNGYIIDLESYSSIKELIDSSHVDNHQLAVNMVIGSDLKNNWEWVLYLYYTKAEHLRNYDKKSIIYNYLGTLNLGYNISDLLGKIDLSLSVIKNPQVKDRFIYLIRSKFQNKINEYFKTLGTEKFKLNDFKIELI